MKSLDNFFKKMLYFIYYNRYIRYSRTQRRTKRKYITIRVCCTGFRQSGTGCPIRKIENFR